MKFEEIKQGVKKVFTVKEEELYKDYQKNIIEFEKSSDIATLKHRISKLKFVNDLEELINDYLEKDEMDTISIDDSKNFSQYLLDILGINLQPTKNDQDKMQTVNNEYTKSLENIKSQYREILIAIDLCATEEQVREEVLKSYGLIDKKTNKLVF